MRKVFEKRACLWLIGLAALLSIIIFIFVYRALLRTRQVMEKMSFVSFVRYRYLPEFHRKTHQWPRDLNLTRSYVTDPATNYEKQILEVQKDYEPQLVVLERDSNHFRGFIRFKDDAQEYPVEWPEAQ